MVNRTNELIKKANEYSVKLSTIHFLDATLEKTTTAFNLVKEKYTSHFLNLFLIPPITKTTTAAKI